MMISKELIAFILILIRYQLITGYSVIFTHPGECPTVPQDGAGICVESCSNDGDCAEDEKCCSNGCGHQCTRACIPQVCDCPHGVDYFNISGCISCSCKKLTCDLVKCPVNHKCEVNSDNIATCVPVQHDGLCPLKPVGRCVPCCNDGDCAQDQKCCGKCCRKSCFPTACRCPYGTIFFNDSNGCPQCKCRPHPCERAKCPIGTTCEVVENACNKTNCAPFRAQCVPLCKYGKPLQNIFCGRGGTTCPSGYFCEIAADDRYAVCCPFKVNPCNNMKCDVDQICVLRDVVCVKAPCDPIPECISNTTLSSNPCDDVKCKVGEKCILESVICVKAPCNPIPRCVPDCPLVICDLYCENGFQTDENGCNICKCVQGNPETKLLI